MLTVLALVASLLSPRPTLPAVVTVAGDSVIVTLSLADNTAAQPVSVDSVEFTVTLTPVGASSTKTVRVAHGSPSTASVAYPLTLWAPGQTLGGPVTVRLGRINAACAGGVCWSTIGQYGSGSAWAWGYTLDTQAPNPPENGKLTVSAGLN